MARHRHTLWHRCCTPLSSRALTPHVSLGLPPWGGLPLLSCCTSLAGRDAPTCAPKHHSVQVTSQFLQSVCSTIGSVLCCCQPRQRECLLASLELVVVPCACVPSPPFPLLRTQTLSLMAHSIAHDELYQSSVDHRKAHQKLRPSA